MACGIVSPDNAGMVGEMQRVAGMEAAPDLHRRADQGRAVGVGHRNIVVEDNRASPCAVGDVDGRADKRPDQGRLVCSDDDGCINNWRGAVLRCESHCRLALLATSGLWLAMEAADHKREVNKRLI